MKQPNPKDPKKHSSAEEQEEEKQAPELSMSENIVLEVGQSLERDNPVQMSQAPRQDMEYPEIYEPFMGSSFHTGRQEVYQTSNMIETQPMMDQFQMNQMQYFQYEMF